MYTCCPSDDPETLPILCTIVVHDENVCATGTVWGFFPHRCHVESPIPLMPGMHVSVSLHLSATARVRLSPGVVTWARAYGRLRKDPVRAGGERPRAILRRRA